VTKRLIGKGIDTLGELVEFCNSHRGSWWRSMPHIGPGRAGVIVAWLRPHENDLGKRIAMRTSIRNRWCRSWVSPTSS